MLEKLCKNVHKTRISIHLTFFTPPIWRARFFTSPLQRNPAFRECRSAAFHPWLGSPESLASNVSILMNQPKESLSERRLVKAVYIYSNGDTLERSWVNRDQRQRPVSIVATNESGSVREFSNHYQVFLRIEKHNPDVPLARPTIFAQAVNILTKMLMLTRRGVKK